MRHRVQGVELLDLHDQQDYTVSNEVDVDEVAIHGLGASNVNQIKDMTTTFDRKKSVRFVLTNVLLLFFVLSNIFIVILVVYKRLTWEIGTDKKIQTGEY